jgi:hypoxanthine phosphoribosyltransferase
VEITDDIQAVLKNAVCLYSAEEVSQALDKMAMQITQELKDANPLILSVMTGALIATGHLLTRLHFLLEVDYIHVTRYRNQLKGRDLHWLVEPRSDLKNRNILIVDDILDGGLTLAAIIDYCKQSGAKAVYTAVLVNKKRKREPGVDFEPHFSGVIAQDKYLFGFGLDYKGYLRNIPGIYYINHQDETD